MVQLPNGAECVVPMASQLCDFITIDILEVRGNVCDVVVLGSLPEHRIARTPFAQHDFRAIHCTILLPAESCEAATAPATIPESDEVPPRPAAERPSGGPCLYDQLMEMMKNSAQDMVFVGIMLASIAGVYHVITKKHSAPEPIPVTTPRHDERPSTPPPSITNDPWLK